MKKWFNSCSRLVQIILLLIPFVNWIIEIGVRWSNFFEKKGLISLILAIVVTIFGIVFGWLDVIWCLIFKHLILAK